MPETKTSNLIYKSTVRSRYRLSASWFERLGEPDALVSNPHHPSGPRASLYSVERVEAFLEQHAEEYQAHLRSQEKRSDAARARWAPHYEAEALARAEELKKEHEVVEWARTVEIVLNEWPEELTACYKSSQELVDQRVVINTLRHRYSNYEDLLEQLDEVLARYSDASRVAHAFLQSRINFEIRTKLKALNIASKTGGEDKAATG